ncbi:MAG: hypothetical protein IPK80_20460 [Nannocystis sp.]|nr:hypothetical protein [Nannocystis sp.]
MSVDAEEVVLQSPLMYRVLRERGGALILEAVVGGAAMYAVRVRLLPSEAAEFAAQGARFSDRLAREIMANPRLGGRAYDPAD